MEELYFVELINRTAPDDELGDVYEMCRKFNYSSKKRRLDINCF